MSRRLISILSIGVILVSAALIRATYLIAELTLAILRTIAPRPGWRFRLPRTVDTLTMPRRGYVGPPVGLRFEAGRPSLAAARGI